MDLPVNPIIKSSVNMVRMLKHTLLFFGLLNASAALAAPLIYGATGEPVNLESGNIVERTSMLPQIQIYDTLVWVKEGEITARPALATRWKGNAQATEWTFALRKGVKFHDGTAFNADAVVFNVMRWWDPNFEHGYRDSGKAFGIWGQLLGGYRGSADGLVKNVQKLDDYTVKFTLNKPYASFPQLIGAGYFGISSPTAIKAQGAKYGTPASRPVGTGPFEFVEWVSGDHITLKPNRNYWGVKSTADQLLIRFIPDANQRLNELRAGSIDFTSDLTPDSLSLIKSDRNLKLVLKPSFNVGFLSLNVKNTFLKDERVRQAISLAVNKKALVEAFYGDLGYTDSGLLPSQLAWALDPDIKDYKFDPALARKILKDAGLNNVSFDLWYPPIARQYYPNPKALAEAIAVDLADVGIKVNLRTQDWAKWVKDSRTEPGYDSYIVGWIGDYGDPDNFYSAYYGPYTSLDSHYYPQELENLLIKARSVKDRVQKAKIYQQIHQFTFKANVRIPLVHSRPVAAMRSNVSGWVPSPLGVEAFNRVKKKVTK